MKTIDHFRYQQYLADFVVKPEDPELLKLPPDEEEGRYDCDQCEKSFSAKISLRYHIMTKHLDGAKINCDKCNKQFSDVKTYICHRATHKSI